MPEYERTTRIRRGPEEVYRFLSSIDNLPAFLPWIRQVRLDSGDHIWAVAEGGGGRRELEGYFRVTPETRRIDWGSDASGYRGWLQVKASGTESELVLHVSFPSAEQMRDAEVDRVVDSIRRAIEEQHGGEVIGGERRVA